MSGITNSERKVAQLLADEGLSDREIAARLGLSEAIVGHYLARTFAKVGVHNRTDLAILWNTEIFQIGLGA